MENFLPDELVEWGRRALVTVENSLDALVTNLPAPWRNWIAEHVPEALQRTWAVPGLVMLLVVLVWLVFRSLRLRTAADTRASLADLTRGPRRFGFATTILLVFGLGTWAFLAPLESAAVAPGVISPEGNRRTVQHLEGGIIRSINVREGDSVEVGQVILSLRGIEARARLEEVGQRYVHLLAKAARLEAEVRGSEQFQLPDVPAIFNAAELKAAVSAQKELLARRNATRQGQDDILHKRIQQLEEENFGLAEMIQGLDEKSRLINEEIDTVLDLIGKGLERKPRLLELERGAADIRIERANNQARISRNNQKIGETEIQLLTMHQQIIETASEELADIRRMLAELDGEMPWRADVLDRTEIRAPISGKVMNVRVTTLNGVVRSGEPILDIVPTEVPLIIDARVKPTDIDVIRIGMRVRVILSAYLERNMPQIFGTLRTISADRLVDENTGEAYYLAKVEVPRTEFYELSEIELVAGMPVQVMLLTGQSTVADYVIGPLKASFRQSFRENQGT